MQGCSPSSLAAGALTMALSFPSAAPQCISFVWLTLAGLRSVVGWVRGGRTLRIACAGECRPRAGGAWGSPCTSPCCRFSQVPCSLNLSSFFFFLFFFLSNFIFFNELFIYFLIFFFSCETVAGRSQGSLVLWKAMPLACHRDRADLQESFPALLLCAGELAGLPGGRGEHCCIPSPGWQRGHRCRQLCLCPAG